MEKYPILVERYEGNESVTIVCTSCDTQELLDPSDLNHDAQWPCEKCPGTMIFMYEEADRCPNCQRLGFYSDFPTKGCCSRVCMLQMEYAESLGVRNG